MSGSSGYGWTRKCGKGLFSEKIPASVGRC
jgi:hypothetical protein